MNLLSKRGIRLLQRENVFTCRFKFLRHLDILPHSRDLQHPHH